ncbi:MAG TPA: UDP-N-acetylglucosamine acyltransferase [Pseudonocardiaceae bacterium]
MVNRIHPTAIIGEGVELGEDNIVGPYAVIVGPSRIGDRNWIGPHVTIGTPAEDRDAPHPAAWEGELAGEGVAIGDDNRLREYVSIHQGTRRTTRLGSRCYLLQNSHISHDGIVEDEVTLAHSVQLGGHTHVWSYANLGMNAVVHQHGRVGPGAMVGMGSAVRREAEAFMVSVGSPVRTVRINTVGLRRRGCGEGDLDALASFLSGTSGLPAGLPADVADLLKRWIDRPPLTS